MDALRVDNLLFTFLLLLSLHLLVLGEVTAKAVVFRQEVAASGIRGIHKSIVDILMVKSDSVLESSLLHVLLVPNLHSLHASSWLDALELSRHLWLLRLLILV